MLRLKVRQCENVTIELPKDEDRLSEVLFDCWRLQMRYIPLRIDSFPTVRIQTCLKIVQKEVKGKFGITKKISLWSNSPDSYLKDSPYQAQNRFSKRIRKTMS